MASYAGGKKLNTPRRKLKVVDFNALVPKKVTLKSGSKY